MFGEFTSVVKTRRVWKSKRTTQAQKINLIFSVTKKTKKMLT